MCGLFGAIGPNLPDTALDRVFQVLDHRGPDESGVFIDRPAQIMIAHTRLAVIDLVTGAQPMQSEDGDVVLACNGEIYDFENIRKFLETRGCRFLTKSDSEVVIHLYREFGLGCFDYIRGEFAFLLYDREKELLIAARDRFGIKPLYFSRVANGFVFASEIKAIFASGLVEPKLNVTGLDPFLLQDPDNARFPFENIEHVAPGCFMAIDLKTRRSAVTRYWSREIPAIVAEPVAESTREQSVDCARSVLRELDEAVRLRLRADVPVGLYLSGGIDSAFVGALMKRHVNSQFHSFSISFVGSEKNEQDLAHRAAEFLGTAHHELAVTKEMLWNHLADCLWFSELPFVTLAPVGKYLLSEQARKIVTVVLTGEGADEVFLGYRGFFDDAIRETRKAQSKGQRSWAPATRLSPAGFAGALTRRSSLFIFHKRHRRALAAARAKALALPMLPRPVINAVQETRIAAMPMDILCFLGDREEMAHSLEARLPFLDDRLYEVARSIPVDVKMRGGVEKAVLRDAAEGILPNDLRLRRKRGFMTTSEPVDLFGADRQSSERFRRYLSRHAFEHSQVFSYGAFRLMTLLARLPGSQQFPALKRLRQNSNKVIMYMMQTHMLHQMFVAEPRWQVSKPEHVRLAVKSEPERELAF